MLEVAMAIAITLIGFAAVHVLCAAWALRWKAPRSRDSSFRHKAAVILAVRGCDPTLRDTLISLIHQDYEPLEIHIVVDHPRDEAFAVVHEIIREHDQRRRCIVQTLQLQSQTCGLKCAAIAQAVRSLKDVTIIATIDADVVPHSTWLAELVAPLADESVGLATGNHWFEPSDASCGSLVRSLWNAGALIPTSFFANPWGGSAAMRLLDVQQSGLIEAWESSAVDDGPIRPAVARMQRRIVFLPSLIMLNRESCSIKFCLNYMARILTWSRVYEPTFGWTVAHLVVNSLPVVAAMVLFDVALLRGEWTAGVVLLSGLIGHSILLWLAYLLVRRAVGRMSRHRAQSLEKLGWRKSLTLMSLVPITLVVYSIAMTRALTARYVCWRGVWYYVTGRSQVVLLSYHPYSQPGKAASKSSL